MGNTKKVDTEKAARIIKTARIVGVTQRSVQRVLKGDQENPVVMETYMEIYEKEKEIEDNLLLKAVIDLVPFTQTTAI